MNRSSLPRWARTARIRSLALLASGALALGALGACSTPTGEAATDSDGAASPNAAADQVVTTSSSGLTAAEVLAENLDASQTVALADTAWDTGDEVAVDLDAPTATDGVEVDGETVTLTAPGTYRLSGTLAGQVVVSAEADGVVRLVLDGADITSATGAAIDVQDADQVSVVLADGSTNRLEDATEYADTTSENAANATLYSTADLAISGSGALEVVGHANDGITGKDGLVITAGDLTVDAADDAVRGKDYLVVTGGTLDLTAGGDGLRSDDDSDATAGYVALLGGDVTVAAGSDGVQGFTDVAVSGGSLTVTGSEEGIEAAVIAISGGTVDVTATDDAVNATVKEAGTDSEESTGGDAAGAEGSATEGSATEGSAEQAGPGGGGGEAVQAGASLTVTGGVLTASGGGDGLDSNGVIDVSGGTIAVATSAAGGGESAVDANGTVTSTGGWLTLDAAADAGSTITVLADDGTQVASVDTTAALPSLTLTADGITAGESYTVAVDGEEVGTATAEESPASAMGGRGGMGGGRPPADGELPDGELPDGAEPPPGAAA
ncbi:carbohydrate-binding domain-containing protein [Isoptericola sp. S6320L]|uniref:carbohydrate-binding domain-containing protein n=1 Tax=Isoptericola sp. S6320L TaxID=2926411 RepID=UPI001FF2B1B6|nr:carbohydrate-binding domain-containing protein [Isoptericola sp. S6320L]MCK0116493.1 carbohydrate-binding domain-containing protein [Isoptericola sp. S6320L]